MKQKQYSPLSVAEMGVLLYAADNKFLDDVAVNKIGSFEASLLSYLRADHGALLAKINESGDYNTDIEASIRGALEKFKATQTW
jgi:F-type H+-transporting ATPase subunit alpha